MALFLILIGAVLIVTSYAGTYAQLAKELETDVPGFFKWGVALAALVALGYIPGLRTPSRWLLALVVFVLVLTNYKRIFPAITSFTQTGTTSTTGGTQQTAQTAAQIPVTGQTGLTPLVPLNVTADTLFGVPFT